MVKSAVLWAAAFAARCFVPPAPGLRTAASALAGSPVALHDRPSLASAGYRDALQARGFGFQSSPRATADGFPARPRGVRERPGGGGARRGGVVLQ